MKLYYSTCTASTPVHIVLEEAGARYERLEVSWQRDLNVAALEKVNPFGAVPALVLDDGAILTQSVAILEHIADTHPKAKLLAAPGTVERAQTLAWCLFASADLMRSFAPIVRADDMTTHDAARSDLRRFGRDQAHQHLEHLDRSLGGKPFVVGDHFTIADAYLFFSVSLAGWLEVDTAQHRHLRPYLQGIAKRPATARVLKLEDLAD